MQEGPVIALVDGEHHPAAVRQALDALDAERGVAAAIFCGGEEKVGTEVLADPEAHYGRALALGLAPAAALRRLVADGTDARAVVDLADEPVLPARARLRLAALALHLGLAYEAPGMWLASPRYERLCYAGPKLAVIGTGKRTGKTAVAGHWAGLLRGAGLAPVIVSMGRGGPAEPTLAEPGTSLERLLEIAAAGFHAASDHLEAAVLAGVPAIGCRRVGGGLAGQPALSNVAAGAALACSLEPAAIVFDGSGACIPPVEVDRTVCVVGDRAGALGELGPYRLLRADLALVPGDRAFVAEVAELAPRVVRFALSPEPAAPVPAGSRVAVFSTGGPPPAGLAAIVASVNLSRRGALLSDLARARAERCDVYLTELKAAAIDTVAIHARAAGARVVFLRNRPVGLDSDLDSELLRLYEQA